MRRRWTHRVALGGLGALAVAACNALAGLDADYGLADGGAAPGDDRPGDGRDASAGEDGPGTQADADAGGRADADASPCADGGMIDVGGYCIDATEVTQAQYLRFLDSGVGLGGGGPPECSWKTGFVPDAGVLPCRWDPARFPNLPVVCVDWCDAVAYCRWAGKRLCGSIGGGPIKWALGEDTDETVDQWYRACSMGGKRQFPYGTIYKAGACNTAEDGYGRVVDAGAMPECVGGFGGLHDMVGNAFEWEDSCQFDAGPTDKCKLRGGSWAKDTATFSSCKGVGLGDTRSARWDDVGFRCCSR